MIYLFKPQLEPVLERRYAHVTTGQPQAASAQVAAALKAVPGSVLNAYELPRKRATRPRVCWSAREHKSSAFSSIRPAFACCTW